LTPPLNTKVTIVIPAYNAANYIATSISSVLAQTFTDWELIIVNDGSKDNTAELVKGYLSDTRIKLIEQANSGVSSARNVGIKAASGKFIALLDADDSYLSNNIETKFNIINADDSIDFVYGDIWKCDKELKPIYVEKGVPTENLFEEVMLWTKETIPGFSSNIMMKANSIRNRFLFDENLSNCADRYMKILLSKNLKGAYIPKPLSNYRDTPGAMSKQVALLDHDEKYIIKEITENNIVPDGSFRRKVIANIYFTLSGSWYKNAGKPLKAIAPALKAIAIYPPFLLKLIKKLF
jgi:glycosyltransferase involved in cell wall biosynthesis